MKSSQPSLSSYRSVVITGASSGLGEEFAKQLAPHTGRMLLIARRLDRLESLKSTLAQSHPDLEVQALRADLLEQQQRETVLTHIENLGWSLDLWINNAGMGCLLYTSDAADD